MDCFVIMPYGKDEREKKAYLRIYKFLIESVAKELGLTCKRSDLEGQGGHIISNVVEDLSDADIVIADISGLNWNVAYELGIRHTFRKNGTILMCNDSTEIPTDIKAQNIVFYPTDWLDSMEEICEQLKKAIENCISGLTVNDSPIHEKYAFLPENIVRNFSESASDKPIKDTLMGLLENELSAIHKKIEDIGSSLDASQSGDIGIDYSKTFLDELENSACSSGDTIAKLRELLHEGKKKEFLTLLGNVLSSGSLDEADCCSIYMLCRNLGISSITRTFLEAVTKFHPESDVLLGFLADEYSKDGGTKEKAVQIVNKIIGVDKKDGVFILSENSRVTTEKLASFFNVYLRLDNYEDLVAIGELLCQRFKTDKKILSITYKNMMFACIKLNDLEKALLYKEPMLACGDSSDTNHWVCFLYETAVENHPGAIKEIETCIKLDPKDIDYYFGMASLICDFLYARDFKTLEIKKISPQEADKFAVPFLVAALSADRTAINRVLEFLRRNKFTSYIQPISYAHQSGITNFHTVLQDLDFSAVEYCTKAQ